MKILLKTILCFTILLVISDVNAQFTIDQEGTIISCAATFHDSDSLLAYQNNENYTMTFCTDGSGNSLNIGFATLFKIDPSDTLFVYDGASIAAPLIGAYNNDNPISGLSSTSSGCLTFQFISDGAIVDSGWVATILCLTLCQPIDPIITTTPAANNYGPDSNYTNICAGDSVQFSVTGTYPDAGANSGSYAQSDATSTFEWEFGNGSNDTGTDVNSTFTNEQGYLVLLTVTDANGCIEVVRHKVRTAITPYFSAIFSTPDTACFADTVNLFGGFTQSLGQNSTVTVDSGYVSAGGIVTGQTFLPDGTGNSYTTNVSISGFSGQSIANGTDIDNVCINMEHSYNGDLDIVLECPNGQQIEIFNGSGGAFMGEPVDVFPVDTAAGIGYDYCFNPNSTNGIPTGNITTVTYTDVLGNINTNVDQIPGGEYEASGNWSDLVGCPIDGDWTLIVTDNLLSDDGYIFQWEVQLNPAISPNIEIYSVDILSGVWLAHGDIINDYDTLAIATPSIVGENDYTFQVTDEFGCTFDTTIQVVVLPELTSTISPDTTVCVGLPVTLDVDYLNTCDYTLTLFDDYGDGWNGATLSLSINGIPFLTNETVPDCNGTTTTGCTATFTLPVTTGDIITMNYTGGTFDSENFVTLSDGAGTTVFTEENPPDGLVGGSISTICGDLLTFLWDPIATLNDPTLINPVFDGSVTTHFTVTANNVKFPQCSTTSDSITIEVINDSLPDLIGDSIFCDGEVAEFSVTSATLYLWSDSSTNSSIRFTPEVDTLITVVASNYCDTVNLNRNIIVNPNPVFTISSDTSIVIQSSVRIVLTTNDSIVNYSWSPQLFLDCSNCPTPIATPTETTTYYTVITDTNGCTTSDNITIEVLLPELFIPTGFSPNNDGVNDIVFVRSLNVSTMILQIFDRWGGLVFETEDQEIGWDGKYNGDELDFGVYVYKFEATLFNGGNIEQSGSITLFR